MIYIFELYSVVSHAAPKTIYIYIDWSLTSGDGQAMFVTDSIPLATDYQETQVEHAPLEEWQNSSGAQSLLGKEDAKEAYIRWWNFLVCYSNTSLHLTCNLGKIFNAIILKVWGDVLNSYIQIVEGQLCQVPFLNREWSQQQWNDWLDQAWSMEPPKAV